MTAPVEPVRWDDGAVRILDQRALPGTVTYWRCREVGEVAEAIETLAVRGAPAIGIAAGYGVLLGAVRGAERGEEPVAAARRAMERLRVTRPTAVNLFYALRRMEAALGGNASAETALAVLRAEADRLLEEDLDTGRRIAAAGLPLFAADRTTTMLTHCNAGGLATGGWGTALAPAYAAHAAGRGVRVFADETRPLLQGGRLTAWELSRAGIDVTVAADGAAASLLHSGEIHLVIVGADRIARNGDTANKIGTFAVALAAASAGVPFYVAAPLSTFDPDLPDGAAIPIEERPEAEVLAASGIRGVRARNPAFDVTPARLIRGWITERGILQPPFDENRRGGA